MLIEVCAFVLAGNEVIECMTGAQNSGDSDCCDWVVVEPGHSVTVPPPPRPAPEGQIPQHRGGLYVTGLTCSRMVKGPTNLGLSFLLGRRSLMSRVDNHTFWPGW